MRSELLDVPGVGERTVAKLLKTLGSLEAVQLATESALSTEVGPAAAKKICACNVRRLGAPSNVIPSPRANAVSSANVSV